MIANQFLKRTLFPCLLTGTLLLTACDKDDDDMPAPGDGTVTGIVVSNNDFSTLESAVIKADLQGTLSGAGPFTVFAPDNDAFAASGVDAAALNSLSADEVENILLYHTLTSRVASGDVPAGPNAKVITASGDSVFVTRNASGVYINGVMVEQADIAASNGVIHRINRVLMPPMGNIVASAQMPGSGLDSLVKAVLRATNAPGGDPTLASTLQSGTLTVFAPNNAAFTGLLTALGLQNIDDIPVGTLLNVLRYHVVAGRAFSSDLSNGNLAMLAGGNTTIGLNDGTGGVPSITGAGNGANKSNIVATNMMARNGVVHVIDRVLLP